MRNLLNFLLFQAGWFVAVEGAARGSMWAGPAAVAVVALIHLLLITDRKRELLFLLGVGLAGTLVDSALAWLGATSYPTSTEAWPYAVVPPWITSLWLGFATLPSRSLAWLAPRPRLAVLFGAIGGPLSYLAGVRLGAVGVGPEPLLTWGALSLEYAVATPVLLGMAQARRRSSAGSGLGSRRRSPGKSGQS